jgi:dolichyl-phosphate beta-glucosyltransferase
MPQGAPVVEPTAPTGGHADGTTAVCGIAPAIAPARALRRARHVGLHLAVIACYALPAVALWWHAWDGHLTSTLTCACGDAGQTVWFVAWPAYAIAHGIDPFFSSLVQSPRGISLLSNASSIPVGIALAPLTWSLGPIAATNVALTLSPALSAWACWFACRRLVAWPWASFVGGLLFGYCPFVVTNLALGHLGLCLLVCPPLLVVAGREVLFGAPDRRTRWGLALGALGALQFFVSSEILAIVMVVGVPTGAVAALVGARARRLAPLPELARAGAAAGALVALTLAWPVWEFLAGPGHLHGPLWASAAVAGNPLDALWRPGAYGARGTTLVRLGGYLGHQGPPPSYLGPVVLCAAAASLLVSWRRRGAWILAGAGLFAAWCSLGVLLSVAPGRVSALWVPWRLFSGLPLLDDVIPQRFSAVVDLCVALVIGIGIDRVRPLLAGSLARRTAGKAGTGRLAALHPAGALLALGGLVVAAAPWWTYQVPLATSAVTVPQWFAAPVGARAHGAVVLSVPFPFPTQGVSAPMVWQAVDGMGFRLAGAYAKVPAPTGRPLATVDVPLVDRVLTALGATVPGPLPTGTARQLNAVRAALRTWRVDDVVVTRGASHVRRAVSLLGTAIGRPPRRLRGAWVWTLRGRSGGDRPPTASARRRVRFGYRGALDLRTGCTVGERPRMAEEEPLCGVAAKARQMGELSLGLYALGDHFEAEGVGQMDHRLDDRTVSLDQAERRHEAAVDLHDVERQLGEPGQ